ncbi:hypothetical protein [Yersinia phage MHG19]|nr:hypothetical protein [Yersinia phage MHG19]
MKHEFRLGDGWYGNVEYTVDKGRYTGTMYVTSEYSLGVSWVEELDEYFINDEYMIDYVEKFIRVNNT